ncbi:nodulation protein NfeD [Piscinibacter sp. XHJ-5]|uniref:NfeD family protein n=1 Tax=Piscinibacter sp. XHJ-5 TaxID=3037797 RepID=UPI00245311C5|nr:nodulation protein NfeD [Piscinibacter sp. XHJ-5]
MWSAGTWLLAMALLAPMAHGASEPAVSPPAAQVRRPVVVTTVDGAIGPATAHHLQRALAAAAKHDAQLVVVQIDTPGGLDTSMRQIIKDVLASSIPVATYVAPNGARAASAGTYLLYASHIAAMAPASNLGAATPVAIGIGGAQPEHGAPAGRPASGASQAEPPADSMTAKRIADAAAYLRSLAQLRGRNAEWAERAVRESVSLSAADALAMKVVDLVAADVPDLLRQLDGREVPVVGGRMRLATRDAPVSSFDADWRSRLLSVITEPSLALILMLVGIYGLLFEFSNPGFVLPGVVGAISLVLALFALQMLPVNYAGLALILLGIAFLVAEAFLPSFGALGLGGVAAFAFGAVLLFDTDAPGFGVPGWLIAVLTLSSAAFVLLVAGMAAKSRQRPLAHGAPQLVGVRGELVEYAGGEGWALVQGEHWKVRGSGDLRPGAQVRVVRVLGTTLEIAAVAEVVAEGA